MIFSALCFSSTHSIDFKLIYLLTCIFEKQIVLKFKIHLLRKLDTWDDYVKFHEIDNIISEDERFGDCKLE